MNKKDITQAKNPVLAGSLPALQRSAARAKQIAAQTGTKLIVNAAGQAGKPNTAAEPNK